MYVQNQIKTLPRFSASVFFKNFNWRPLASISCNMLQLDAFCIRPNQFISIQIIMSAFNVFNARLMHPPSPPPPTPQHWQ